MALGIVGSPLVCNSGVSEIVSGPYVSKLQKSDLGRSEEMKQQDRVGRGRSMRTLKVLCNISCFSGCRLSEWSHASRSVPAGYALDQQYFNLTHSGVTQLFVSFEILSASLRNFWKTRALTTETTSVVGICPKNALIGLLDPLPRALGSFRSHCYRWSKVSSSAFWKLLVRATRYTRDQTGNSSSLPV